MQIRESLQSLQNSVVTVATEAVETPGVSTASVVNKNTPISVTVATPDPLQLHYCDAALQPDHAINTLTSFSSPAQVTRSVHAHHVFFLAFMLVLLS